MSSEPTQVENGAMTADQQAVAEYFASDNYQRRSRPGEDLYRGGPTSSFIEFEGGAPLSFMMGVLGLCVLVVIFAVAMPVMMKLVEEFMTNRPTYLMLTLIIQTIVIPPLIAFSFAIVTPMFWYGWVLLRFVVGALVVIPGCVAWYVTMELLDQGMPHDFVQAFASVMFSQFLAVGTVSLIIQSWSPWALTHARDDDAPLPSLGTRALLELTGVAAIGFAAFLSIDTNEYLEGLLFFTAIGLSSACAVISILIAFLRENPRLRRAAAISGFFAFGMALIFTGTIAALEFSSASLLYEFPMIAMMALYGGAINFGIMWLCVSWLRFCGWRCVNRTEEREFEKRLQGKT